MHLKTALKYMKQKLTKAEGGLDDITITVRDFNTPFSIMARTTRQKINKEMEDSDNPESNKHL